MKYNFDKKRFLLVANSDSGEVDTSTVFEYQQDGDVVTADYEGGTVITGKIIAHIVDDKLHMLYQCITTDKTLKAGKAIADITITDKQKIQLTLDWQWLNGSGDKGRSTYIEE